MPSRVYMICNAYESGIGHGLKGDGLDEARTRHADPELGEAYQIGYDQGQENLKRAFELDVSINMDTYEAIYQFSPNDGVWRDMPESDYRVLRSLHENPYLSLRVLYVKTN